MYHYFRRTYSLHELCALLDYHPASSGEFLPTFRDNQWVTSSRFQIQYPSSVYNVPFRNVNTRLHGVMTQMMTVFSIPQLFVPVKRPLHSQLNWAILLCDIPDGKTEQTAQFWQAIAQASELSFPVVFHTQNCAVHSGNATVSLSLPADTTMA